MTTTVHELRGQPGRRSKGVLASAALAVALLVSGCGVAMKFGYGQAAPLAYRWLDGFVEFEPKQETRVRSALDDFMAWHRRTQLRDYVQLLSKAEGEIAGEATPERMCGWVRDVRSRLDALVEQAMPTMVEVLPTLQAHQIANIQRTQTERNEDWRSDYLQRDLAKRKREAVKRETDRAESLYGRLEREQKALIEKSVLESPLDGERSYALRLRRQQDLLETLRRVAAPGTSPTEAEAQIRGYLKRVERSPREEDRRYAQQVTDYNCAFAATLHNTTTPTQRQHAAKKLKGYVEDFRALAGGPAS